MTLYYCARARKKAVQTLRNGESRISIAADANLIIGPEIYTAKSRLKLLSPSSRSRIRDINADVSARGDGIATIEMKTLSTALEDSGHIECVIRETGVNQNSRVNSKGITVSSAATRKSLIHHTYVRAGLDRRINTTAASSSRRMVQKRKLVI